MPDFKNGSSLYLAIVKKLNEASDEAIGEFLVEQTKDKVDEEVYESYSPKEYERTYQLRDNIDYKKTVYKRKIAITIKNKNMKGYTSVLGDNPDVSKSIVEIVGKGAYPLFGNDEYTKKRDYYFQQKLDMENKKEYLEKYKEELRKKGLIII